MNGRATNDVPPATARAIRLRDHGRCRVPGCRSARGLEIHHIIHREHGGTHDPANLILVCSSCHQAHHDRRITISGTAEHLEVTRAHVGVRHDISSTLVQLGWKPAIVRAALAEIDVDAPLEEVLRAALQRCAALAS